MINEKQNLMVLFFCPKNYIIFLTNISFNVLYNDELKEGIIIFEIKEGLFFYILYGYGIWDRLVEAEAVFKLKIL